jgi:uncharacterized protein (DUF1778 family)
MSMIRPPSRERPVYTLRISAAERGLLQAAAIKRGEYLAEFIREAALEMARQNLTETTAEVGA